MIRGFNGIFDDFVDFVVMDVEEFCHVSGAGVGRVKVINTLFPLVDQADALAFHGEGLVIVLFI